MPVDPLADGISRLAAKLDALYRQAVRDYTPIVEGILRTRSHNTLHIEETLDGLLGFCCHEPALDLYRRLCRHYWDIDSAATAFYVNAYRTTWDDDEERQ